MNTTSLKELTIYDYAKMPAHASTFDASQVMKEQNIGAVLVIEGLKVVGIFSERDVMNRVVSKCRAPMETPLSKVMTTDLITVPMSTRPTVAIELMHRKKIRHLPVTENDKIVGVVNLRSLLSFVIKNLVQINRNLQVELDQLRFFGLQEDSDELKDKNLAS